MHPDLSKSLGFIHTTPGPDSNAGRVMQELCGRGCLTGPIACRVGVTLFRYMIGSRSVKWTVVTKKSSRSQLQAKENSAVKVVTSCIDDCSWNYLSDNEWEILRFCCSIGFGVLVIDLVISAKIRGGIKGEKVCKAPSAAGPN